MIIKSKYRKSYENNIYYLEINENNFIDDNYKYFINEFINAVQHIAEKNLKETNNVDKKCFTSMQNVRLQCDSNKTCKLYLGHYGIYHTEYIRENFVAPDIVHVLNNCIYEFNEEKEIVQIDIPNDFIKMITFDDIPISYNCGIMWTYK